RQARVAHFLLDSRNENLPKKHIHQNYAETPGRHTAPGFLLRGRKLRPRKAYSFASRKGDKLCSFRKAKAEIPPAGRAGRATRQRPGGKCCWRARARRSRAKRSSSPKAAIWWGLACAGPG